ncbi:MAG: hypothetical protein IPF57_14515 [Gammaproteobacteria bacterium]|nr:hypothetical protein [Gammaproteobacteria bacterium]
MQRLDLLLLRGDVLCVLCEQSDQCVALVGEFVCSSNHAPQCTHARARAQKIAQ